MEPIVCWWAPAFRPGRTRGPPWRRRLLRRTMAPARTARAGGGAPSGYPTGARLVQLRDRRSVSLGQAAAACPFSHRAALAEVPHGVARSPKCLARTAARRRFDTASSCCSSPRSRFLPARRRGRWPRPRTRPSPRRARARSSLATRSWCGCAAPARRFGRSSAGVMSLGVSAAHGEGCGSLGSSVDGTSPWATTGWWWAQGGARVGAMRPAASSSAVG